MLDDRPGYPTWSQPGSNRRPPACKAGALPTELWPRRGPSVEAGDCPQRVRLPQRSASDLHTPGPGLLRASVVEIEVARWPLFEPEPVVLGRILEELRGLLEHVALVLT
jgi:hypothetical protein